MQCAVQLDRANRNAESQRQNTGHCRIHVSSILVLPIQVVEDLDDSELEGVVTHEIAHIVLNGSQQGCSSGWALFVRWASPLNVLFTRFMRREEELACDEVASRITGNPEAVGSALLKTHRMSRVEQSRAFAPLTGLTIQRHFLSQRVTALLELVQAPAGLTRGRLPQCGSLFFFVVIVL